MNDESKISAETLGLPNNVTMSEYITSYLKESKAEAENTSHPAWLHEFFSTFNAGLQERHKLASAGNRNFVTTAFAQSVKHLLPARVNVQKEVVLRDFLSFENNGPLAKLLNAKRVDFVVERQHKRLLIEFKTSINFNDLAAAMTEMLVVKKFAKAHTSGTIFTSSLHLFQYKTNVEGLRELNRSLSSPLDFIWVLCKAPPLKFDVNAITEFRNAVDHCLN
jgi:hypothetical protein